MKKHRHYCGRGSIISIVPQLLHDDTFRRLYRGRDLLTAEYQSRVLLEQAAREACLSEFHFHRLFRATFAETPHDFLTRLRMDRARQMLASERSVTEVCFEIGYGNLGSFFSKFRAQLAAPPLNFSVRSAASSDTALLGAC